MSNKNLTIGLIVVAIIAIIGVFTPVGQSLSASFGSVGGKLIEQYDPYVRYNGGISTALPFKTTSTMQIGSNGNMTNQLSFGSCTIYANANTIAASSTQQVACNGNTTGGITAIANIPANANCSLIEASSTATTGSGLIVTGASASSTAGSIVAGLSNLTGTTFTWSATASSSAQWNYVCYQ